jgi:hypothetical protein
MTRAICSSMAIRSELRICFSQFPLECGGEINAAVESIGLSVASSAGR